MTRLEHLDSCFEALTGHTPFPWQQALFADFVAMRFPKTLDIPTGLGKTAIIALWLLALAHHCRARTESKFPRRLVYVVNRRTVVDQATREAENLREALLNKPQLHPVADVLRSLGARDSDAPLAISTLRGQFADNAEWRDDPARPAVIVGTVDMIGSRLLFSGYGRGFKSRPLHAGFLAQDALLVHDEAHLEPAFQELISSIESEQQRCREFSRFRVVALTATSRRDGKEKSGLTDADRKHAEVRKRIKAKKGIAFFPVDHEKKLPEQVAERALKHKNTGQAVLVFLRKLEDVEKVAGQLAKTSTAQTLTGTMRGLERDALAKGDAVFARFLPEAKRVVTPEQGTVYLVCTSAGEVGIDISADHLVCDLSPFDSMAQRLGRVNRFGNGDARIDVVHVRPSKSDGTEAEPDSGDSNDGVGDGGPKKRKSKPSAFDQRCARTLPLLRQLHQREDQRYDASPGSLSALPAADREAAFTPQPAILPTSEILFDAWALTSIRQKLPGRPPVADWLHGVAEWEPPETHVAWREEISALTGDLLERFRPEDLLEDYPIKPHELLRDRTKRVFEHLKELAARHAGSPVWVIEDSGSVNVTTLGELTKGKDAALSDRTVLLPPFVGGLGINGGRPTGMLDGSADFNGAHATLYDVADKLLDEKDASRRCRVWDHDDAPGGMRLIRTIDTRPDADDDPDREAQEFGRRYWRWYVRPREADDDGSRTARQKQDLTPHLQSAKDYAGHLVAKLGLKELDQDVSAAVPLAAGWHDLGKHRAIWQRSIGNRTYPKEVLAKSGGRMQPVDLNNYRHEFGSLIDVLTLPDFVELMPEVQDLVLHLIAAHHGRARPHFPADEAFDPERTSEAAASIAREVPRRFARLQRKYGRWGLAYIESLVRAADALASQANEALAVREVDR